MIIHIAKNNDMMAMQNKKACSTDQSADRLPPTKQASPLYIPLPHRESVVQSVCCTALSLTLGLACSILTIDAAWAIGDTVLDGSMIAKGSTQNFGSGSFTVPQTVGTISGTNLFHSFATFNINTGQTVTFTGDASLQNVISRITGGSVSDVNGTLISNVGNANFYLINPARVIFGPNASINVPAAFHVSTTDKIKFENGELAVSDLNANTLSLAAPPVALSFSATNAYNNGLIRINGSGSQNAAPFNVKGNTLDVVAGKIDIESTKDQKVSLTQPGAIRMVAMQGPGSVNVDTSTLTDASGRALGKPSASSGGDITINDATANISGDPNGTIKTTAAGGSIKLWGGKINVSGFDIASTGGLGNVKVQANTLTLDNQGTISADTSNTKTSDTTNAGNVTVEATDTLNVLKGSSITSNTTTSGNAGVVAIKANTITVDNKSSISADTIKPKVTQATNKNAGNAGNVNVEATDTLTILNNSSITADTATAGKGGDVSVKANIIKIDGQSSKNNTLTKISSDAAQSSGTYGTSGHVKVTADSTLDISNGGISSRSSIGGGGGGAIDVTANKWMHMTNGIITVSTSTNSNETLLPGHITITAPNIVLKDSQIISSGTGDVPAGDININASHSLMMDPSSIATDSLSGKGGNINIKGGELIYLKGSGFTTNANGNNNDAGAITATADVLVMDNSYIVANAQNGQGGLIQLNIGVTIPSGNLLDLGKTKPISFNFKDRATFYTLGYNLIQAASASGISGGKPPTIVQLNLSNAIANIGAPAFREMDLSQDYCDIGSGSTLPTKERRGGLQPKATGGPNARRNDKSLHPQLNNRKPTCHEKR